MTDQMQREDDLETVTPKIETEPQPAPLPTQQPTSNKAPPVQVLAQREVMAIMPRNMDEAWKMANAFFVANMVPDSLTGDNAEQTKAKTMLAICKGSEVGFAPVTAVSTIMVINNKACIYGDGATALVQRSGKIDWIKTTIESPNNSGKWGEGYKVTVSLKRKDQDEPYVRSFSFEDAKRARLHGKKGPWTDYPERQCYWRAASWAYRDGAADALMGLSVAEEVRDYETTAARDHSADTSSLDDEAKPNAA